jgi:hypothetical protein
MKTNQQQDMKHQPTKSSNQEIQTEPMNKNAQSNRQEYRREPRGDQFRQLDSNEAGNIPAMINIVKGWWQRAPRKLRIDPVPCRREARPKQLSRS